MKDSAPKEGIENNPSLPEWLYWVLGGLLLIALVTSILALTEDQTYCLRLDGRAAASSFLVRYPSPLLSIF